MCLWGIVNTFNNSFEHPVNLTSTSAQILTRVHIISHDDHIQTHFKCVYVPFSTRPVSQFGSSFTMLTLPDGHDDQDDGAHVCEKCLKARGDFCCAY